MLYLNKQNKFGSRAFYFFIGFVKNRCEKISFSFNRFENSGISNKKITTFFVKFKILGVKLDFASLHDF